MSNGSVSEAAHDAKRRRVEHENPSSEFNRDADIWFDDGNIIITAGPRLTGVSRPWSCGFKCHKAVLACNSAVFETMFTLPNGNGESTDGIHTVDFPDDVDDVKDFLKAIYGCL